MLWRLPSTETFQYESSSTTNVTTGSKTVFVGGTVTNFSLPLWLPFAATIFPTTVLWYRDRRAVKPGHCLRCGYNLTGNESGICPECSTPIPKQEATA